MSSDSLTLFVGNLPYNIEDRDLEDFFHGCAVRSVRLVRDRETNRMRGFGFVEFEDESSVSKGLDLDGCKLRDRPLQVERTRGGGGGGGGGRRGGGGGGYRSGGGYRGGRDDYRGGRDDYRGGGGYRDSYRGGSGYRDDYRGGGGGGGGGGYRDDYRGGSGGGYRDDYRRDGRGYDGGYGDRRY